jgi:SAM-dependent methyltransferase
MGLSRLHPRHWRFLRYLRSFLPDSRKDQLKAELRFWRRWLKSRGLEWPEDYRMRLDPDTPVQDHLARVIDRLPGAEIEILDVGSGPMTKLGKIHPEKSLAITATDPLADSYNDLFAEFGISPPVRTEYAEAEALRATLGDRLFNIVHAQNSLDHATDPVQGIGEMLALTRPGGFVVLLHEENEGKNEFYYGLHKWDFTCERGRFVIAGPGPGGPRRDITAILADCAEVECSIREGEILVVIRKLQQS